MSKPVITIADQNRLRHLARMEDRRDDALIARERRAAAKRAEHLDRNEDRRIQALIDKQDRIAAGIAKRDAHNLALSNDKARSVAAQLIDAANDNVVKAAGYTHNPVLAAALIEDADTMRATAGRLLALAA